MSRRSAGKKAYRVLDFLTGLGDQEVLVALSQHGFEAAEVERGWALLRGLGARRAASPPAAARSNAVLRQLDAWENRWFVVAEAALAAHLPAAHAWLFHRLRRQSGPEVVLGVSTFVGRLRALEAGVPELAADGAAARALLEKRGLTAEVVAEAEALLTQVAELEPPRPAPTPSVADAEARLWAWYLEWSQIARAVLREPRLLSHLGLGRPGRPAKGART